MRKRDVIQSVNEIGPKLIELSDWMYRNPELGFKEYGAADRICSMLKDEGFDVERQVAGMETAFVGSYTGSSPGPTIALFAEYDALAEIGHACGHNISGCASLGAAIALKRSWPDSPGSIKLIGSPAEEGGGGKVILAEAGALEGVDIAMMIHASNVTRVYCNNLSVKRMVITFEGRTAQPAGTAHEGVSAFEAAILTWTNINAIRQYLPPDFYVHGIMREGGFAANVIPDKAVLVLYARARRGTDVDYLSKRIEDCANAAALTVGAKVRLEEMGKRYLRVVTNPVLAALMEQNMTELGLVVQQPSSKPRASTDMGNVSYVVPSVHAYVSIGDPKKIGNTHSPEFAPQTATPEGHSALLNAAKAMAMTTVDLLSDLSLVDKSRSIHAEQMRKELGN